ncbi:MAG TPA: hypothetical protein VHF90_00975, partial [Thermoleophilaceae bacterium]|nr:hypothetical protein [Thermoleophilaceae bacterium]
VDPYLLVEEYRLTEERSDAPEFQPLAPMPARDRPRDRGRGGRRQPQRPPRRGGLIAGALVIGLIGFLLLLGLLGGDSDDDPPDDRATTTETQPSVSQQRQRQRALQRRRRAAAVPRGVNVRIAPAEPTYVCVDTGPGTPVVFESTLEAPRSFRDARQVRVNLGKRSAAVALNGEPVTLDPSGDPIALDLTRGGSTEIDATEAPCA